MEEITIRNENGLTENEFLEQYDDSKYPHASNTVDTVIFTVEDEDNNNYRKSPEKELKVLLVKRKDHPFIGKWAIPGGFVDVNKESLDEAAYRELFEETNVEGLYLEQLYTWGAVMRDPRTRVISTSYLSLIDSSSVNVKAGSDAEDVKWFSLKSNVIEEKKTITEQGYIFEKTIKLELSNGDIRLSPIIRKCKIVEGKVSKVEFEIIENDNISFDHAVILQYSLERLRNKIEYTDIAFNLMPEYFTYNELQKVYEIILNKDLIGPNFRRKMKSSQMVIETDTVRKGAGHNPPQLIKFNPYWTEEF